MISILTATYDRAFILPEAYESLKRQSSTNFQWVVVDDGSTDETRSLVEKWIAESVISIEYHYKENGGKHTALNLGVKIASGELCIILDSDDHLSDDAVETIEREWSETSERDRLCGLCFLKGYSSTGKPTGTLFPEDRYIASSIKLRNVDKVKGDKAEVYRTDILREFPFPVFENERFLSEEIVWNRIARKYEMSHINRIVYLCEYLEDGLSAAERRNPPNYCIEGSILRWNEKTTADFPFLKRIKHTGSYISFSLWKYSIVKTVRNSKNPLLCFTLLPFGILKHYYDHFKYKRKTQKSR